MKLYKDGKIMQSVDKDQLEICLEAGWSRTDKVAEKAKAKADAEAAEEAELQAQIEAEEAEKAKEADESSKEAKVVQKKTRIKSLKKR